MSEDRREKIAEIVRQVRDEAQTVEYPDAYAYADAIIALLPTEGEPVGWYVERTGFVTDDQKDAEQEAAWYNDGPKALSPGHTSDAVAVPLYATPQESADVEVVVPEPGEWFHAEPNAEVERLREAMSYVRHKLAGRGAKFTKAWDRLMQECVEHLDRAALNTETDG